MTFEWGYEDRGKLMEFKRREDLRELLAAGKIIGPVGNFTIKIYDKIFQRKSSLHLCFEKAEEYGLKNGWPIIDTKYTTWMHGFNAECRFDFYDVVIEP